MAKKRSYVEKAANRKYAKRAGLDVEVAGQLGEQNGRYNAQAVTEHDNARKQQNKKQNQNQR